VAPLEEREAAFRRAHPRYGDTAVLDELRRSDFARLDAGGHVYLDYTGAGLYADSQLREHLELLQTGVFGNPHSVNPTSVAMTELVERARAAALELFRASPEEYVAIFTPNATGALRLVGEAYPFRPGDRFLLSFDNHNSVNGIREFARARGAETTYVPSEPPELRVDEQLLPRYLTEVSGEHHNLFAYPAQSNFSGVQHPLDWIERAHAQGWDVLLDAAAYVPTNRLDLSQRHLRRALFLQNVRLANGRRRPDRPPRGARQARAALVLGRHDRRRLRATRVVPIRPRRCPLRGRDRQLPQPARGRDRPPPARASRDRDDPRSRRGARQPAARRAGLAPARKGLTGGRDLRAARLRTPRRHDRIQLPPPRRSSPSTSATSTASPAGTASPCAPAASATLAPARSPSPSPARRSSAASSAKG
jgi:Aminotransferase class-V